MQKVRVKSVSIKRGENKNGPWVNTRVTGDDGTVFSTFHKGAAEIAAGDVIELNPVVSDKGNNFDDWNMLEKSTASASSESAPAASGSGYKRDTEAIRIEYGLKAHLQAIERASIEAQTAYNGIIQLAHSQVESLRESTPVLDAITEAIAWARAKMKATLVNQDTSEPPRSKSEGGQPETLEKDLASTEDKAPEPQSFPHVGALLKWCADNGVDRATFLGIVGATEKDLPKVNVEDAYQAVLQYLANKSDPAGEVPF